MNSVTERANGGRPAESVFSSKRKITAPEVKLPPGFRLNERLKMDGIKFLSALPLNGFPAVFFDPQYRGVLDKLNYGNEGQKRGRERSELKQMPEKTIRGFILGIDRILMPSGHLFLWTDKFHLCTGLSHWLTGTRLDVVDMMTWNKERIGMGYRTRRTGEYVVILQKQPLRAKDVWRIHNIPDVWSEKVKRNGHTHSKPVELQGALIEAVSLPEDIIVDPAAGSFSVSKAARLKGRNFLGCDING